LKKFVLFILLCTVLFTALTITGCAPTAGKLEKITANGEIIVYTDPNFSPFEFLGADGVTGVDIEIAKAIAAELNVKVTFQEANFDAILMSLKGGKGDIAISGFTITDERKKSVDFSDPYIESVQYLILPEGGATAVIEDLAGKKVGVAKGYTGQFLMEDELADGGVLAGSGTELKEYNSAMEAALDLKAGRIDAVVMDEYVAKNIVANNSGIETKALAYKNGGLASEEYGVAIPKGNGDLLAKINAVIKRLIEEDKIREWVIQFSE